MDGFANCLYNYEPVADMMVSHIMDHHGCKVIDFVGGPNDEFHDSIERYFVKAMKSAAMISQKNAYTTESTGFTTFPALPAR